MRYASPNAVDTINTVTSLSSLSLLLLVPGWDNIEEISCCNTKFILMTYFILGQRTSLQAIACCGVIVGGFYLGVDQEDAAGSFSLTGTIYGVLASLFVSLFSIYTKKILPVVDGNIWALTFYNNVNACVLFLPLMIMFGKLSIVFNFQFLNILNFWFLMTVGGIFG